MKVFHQKKPDWLKKRLAINNEQKQVYNLLRRSNLHTVCESALCPNIAECFGKKTATFMILGDICTRNCRFCAISSGTPLPVDSDEPKRLVFAAREMGLKHIVITSVTRDDLPDGGARHFARTVEEIHKEFPTATIEVLTPDFQGDESSLEIVIHSHPDIFNHNLETVPRLYHEIRPMADYRRSLSILKKAKDIDPNINTKSGIMLGLGEHRQEVSKAMSDLLDAGCDILTVGQYLSPSQGHAEIKEYIHPDVFKDIERKAYELGFAYVASGPFVRSSFNAAEACNALNKNKFTIQVI